VVCPTSLVTNWENEARKFTPELKTLVLEGADRAVRFKSIADVDMVITSYALLRRDIDTLREINFSTAVLDEAQHIKNPETQNAQAAFALRAKHRFVLTGTPMENSVRDLWSITNFALPGYLGNRNDFREEAIDGDHHLLDFSQFVSMLHLIRERLEKLEIPFCYLDGSTKQRHEIVDRFQSDSAIPVFLISLKAGGVGLNLSAADTVIHFDPWWNHAVEGQAT